MDHEGDGVPPDPGVLAAFGLAGPPKRLRGGRGLAWAVDDVVLKPAEASAQQLGWEATVLGGLLVDNVRFAPPLPAIGGGWIVDGWSAAPLLEGEHVNGRWEEIVAVGDRLHAAMSPLAAPSFLRHRKDRWAVADRIAWGEASIDAFRSFALIDRLADARRPVLAANQLIHGDLTGNVLFAAGLPPAVIDLSLFWRPAAYATAIVVADALCWEGAPVSLVRIGSRHGEFDQLLLRALLFRMIVDCIEVGPTTSLEPYRSTVELVVERVTSPS